MIGNTLETIRQRMETQEAVARWVNAWTKAMRTRDPELVAAVYAEDAVAKTHPFRAPTLGRNGVREYARSTFVDEETLEVRFGQPVVEGSRATVEYWAVLKAKRGLVTLSGITVLRFRPKGFALSTGTTGLCNRDGSILPRSGDDNSKNGACPREGLRPSGLAEWASQTLASTCIAYEGLDKEKASTVRVWKKTLLSE